MCPSSKLTHQQLRQMASLNPDSGPRSSTECTICLNAIAPCQALFVAPCSHTWHFKCARKLLDEPPISEFTCPNCRAQTYLDADVDEPDEYPESGSEVADSMEQLSLGSNHASNPDRASSISDPDDDDDDDDREVTSIPINGGTFLPFLPQQTMILILLG